MNEQIILKLQNVKKYFYNKVNIIDTLLKKNKQTAEAKEMCKRVLESGDYYKALLIISEYVETELSPPPKENKKTKKKNQPER